MARLLKYLALLLGLFLLSACTIIPGGPAAVDGIEITATPTLDPSGYQGVAPRACQVNSLSVVQAERRAAGQVHWLQGSLIAFQPDKAHLAYIAPAERTSWFTGDLTLVSGPDFSVRRPLAPAIQAAGDLTWSPSGEWLAFLAFRPNDNVQTVMVVHDDGTSLTDLFPTDQARTDTRTSQKAILGWKNDSTLQVMSSCGEECRLAFDINVGSQPEIGLIPTEVSDYHELSNNLQIPRRANDYKPELFPKNMTSPNWSTDDSLVAYLDKKGLLWVLDTGDKTHYLVDIGLRDVTETQWSSKSDWLAIRAEDRVFVYQVPCLAPIP